MLILLIGPKGGGKSHVGRLLESALGVHFFHAEPHWMAHHDECAQAGRNPSIELSASLDLEFDLVLETTGLSDAEILESFGRFVKT